MNSKIKIPVVQKILEANEELARSNRKRLDAAQCYGINLMASPGAGKTSFILQTIDILKSTTKIGVVEGDTAPVTIDAEKIAASGVPVVQINTGGDCHLDASMVFEGFNQLPISNLELVIVENVGNLVCPAAFALGTHANVLIASIPEGDDKPYKYPNIYRGLDVLILNKIDLHPYVSFNIEYFVEGVRLLNPGLVIFHVSCKTGDGIPEWTQWLNQQIRIQFPESQK